MSRLPFDVTLIEGQILEAAAFKLYAFYVLLRDIRLLSCVDIHWLCQRLRAIPNRPTYSVQCVMEDNGRHSDRHELVIDSVEKKSDHQEAPQSRKSHKKSRNGCLYCKRRRIKVMSCPLYNVRHIRSLIFRYLSYLGTFSLH